MARPAERKTASDKFVKEQEERRSPSPKGGGGESDGGSDRGGDDDGGDDDGGSTSSGTKKSGSSSEDDDDSVTLVGGRSASSGDGGGSPTIIPTGYVFYGRLQGGGTRDSLISGTSRYGSGYPYGGWGSYVGGRPFPYGFWPVYMYHYDYYGNGEYGPPTNNSRPGGNMTQIEVTSSLWAQGDVSNATSPYWLIGDYDTVLAVSRFIQTTCSANLSQPQEINPTNLSAVAPEQVLKYYRSSSLALALTSYNNSASSLANEPASNSSSLSTIPDAPIPPGTNITFLNCINSTILAQVPIMNSGRSLHAAGMSLNVAQFALISTLLWIMGWI